MTISSRLSIFNYRIFVFVCQVKRHNLCINLTAKNFEEKLEQNF